MQEENTMLFFVNDYGEGCHEAILDALIKTNYEQLPGYGSDLYTIRAKEKIKALCGQEDAEVYFLSGGTQTNQIVISTMLAPYEGVIAPESGHISVHEAGAIEHTGHEVLMLPACHGKLSAGTLKDFLETFYEDGNHEHMTYPGMVYISYPTEFGTLYTRDELEAIYAVCQRFEIPLFIDGARLGYGLSACDDMTLETIAHLCDVFYIGGTKIGALCGEAVVFTHHNAPKHFITQVKQNGGLLAKGRLLGIQFDTLMNDDLYFQISDHAIRMARKMKQGFIDHGYRFLLDSPTNQQFIILENQQMADLSSKVQFSFWEKYDASHTVVRFATSWATREEDVDALLALL